MAYAMRFWGSRYLTNHQQDSMIEPTSIGESWQILEILHLHNLLCHILEMKLH